MSDNNEVEILFRLNVERFRRDLEEVEELTVQSGQKISQAMSEPGEIEASHGAPPPFSIGNNQARSATPDEAEAAENLLKRQSPATPPIAPSSSTAPETEQQQSSAVQKLFAELNRAKEYGQDAPDVAAASVASVKRKASRLASDEGEDPRAVQELIAAAQELGLALKERAKQQQEKPTEQETVQQQPVAAMPQNPSEKTQQENLLNRLIGNATTAPAVPSTILQQPKQAPEGGDSLHESWQQFHRIQQYAGKAPDVALHQLQGQDGLASKVLKLGASNTESVEQWQELINAIRDLTKGLKDQRDKDGDNPVVQILKNMHAKQIYETGSTAISKATHGDLLGGAGTAAGGVVGALVAGPIGAAVGANLLGGLGSGATQLMQSADRARQYQVEATDTAAGFGGLGELKALEIQQISDWQQKGFKPQETLQFVDSLREKNVIDKVGPQEQELIKALQELTRATGMSSDAMINLYANYKTQGGNGSANDYMAQMVGGAVAAGMKENLQQYGELVNSARSQVVQRSGAADTDGKAMERMQNIVAMMTGGGGATGALFRDNPMMAQSALSGFLSSGGAQSYSYDSVAMQIAGVERGKTDAAYATPEQQAENAVKRMSSVIDKSLLSEQGLSIMGVSREELTQKVQQDPDYLRKMISSDNPNSKQASALQDLVNVQFQGQYGRKIAGEDVAMLTQLGTVAAKNQGNIPLDAIAADGKSVQKMVEESGKSEAEKTRELQAEREAKMLELLDNFVGALNKLDETTNSLLDSAIEIGKGVDGLNKEGIPGIGAKILEFGANVGEKIGEFAGAVGKKTEEFGIEVGKGLDNLAQNFEGGVKNFRAGVDESIKAFQEDGVKGLATKIGEFTTEGVGGLAQKIVEFREQGIGPLIKILGSLMGGASGMLGGIGNSIGGAIGNAIGGVGDALGIGGGASGGWIQSLRGSAEGLSGIMGGAGDAATMPGGGGGIFSPLVGKSLDEVVAYQPMDSQDFLAYRDRANGPDIHGGIDYDSSINAGAGAKVQAVQGGTATMYAVGDSAGEASVAVEVKFVDDQGREITQTYTHLSESAVQKALGLNYDNSVEVKAGQLLGAVGETDNLSSGAHLDFKIKSDGEYVNPTEYLAAMNAGSGTAHTPSGQALTFNAPSPAPTVVASQPAPQASAGSGDWFSGGSGSLAARIVGMSEGNRTADGGFTQYYYGHTDPGNGVHNIGSFSAQQGQGSGEEADRQWNEKLKREYATYAERAQAAGLNPNDPRLMSNWMDLYIQAPEAVTASNGLYDQFSAVAQQGISDQSLLQARVNSYYDEHGTLKAGGFGNNLDRLRADQMRRMGELNRGIQAYFHDTPPGGVTATPEFRTFQFDPGDIVHAYKSVVPPAESFGSARGLIPTTPFEFELSNKKKKSGDGDNEEKEKKQLADELEQGLQETLRSLQKQKKPKGLSATPDEYDLPDIGDFSGKTDKGPIDLESLMQSAPADAPVAEAAPLPEAPAVGAPAQQDSGANSILSEILAAIRQIGDWLASNVKGMPQVPIAPPVGVAPAAMPTAPIPVQVNMPASLPGAGGDSPQVVAPVGGGTGTGGSISDVRGDRWETEQAKAVNPAVPSGAAPQTGGGTFASGLYTAPESNNGGSSEYHVDSKFRSDLPIAEVTKLFDQMAAGYAEQGRKIEFSNPGVEDEVYSLDMDQKEKESLIQRAFAAHSHSSHEGWNSLDYYIPNVGENRFKASAENAEILLPNVAGGRVEYGSGGGYGNFAAIVDASGQNIMRTGHGDDRRALPSNRALSAPTPQVVASQPAPQPAAAPQQQPSTAAPAGATQLNQSELYRLATLSTLEASTAMGRLDVAQSVMNRVNSGAYGDSVTDVLYAPGQYEPFFGADPSQINNLDSAAQFLSHERGMSLEQAKKTLQETIGMFGDQSKMADAARHVGGRTEFKGVSQYGNRVASEDPLRSQGENFFHIGTYQTYDQLAQYEAKAPTAIVAEGTQVAAAPSQPAAQAAPTVQPAAAGVSPAAPPQSIAPTAPKPDSGFILGDPIFAAEARGVFGDSVPAAADVAPLPEVPTLDSEFQVPAAADLTFKTDGSDLVAPTELDQDKALALYPSLQGMDLAAGNRTDLPTAPTLDDRFQVRPRSGRPTLKLDASDLAIPSEIDAAAATVGAPALQGVDLGAAATSPIAPPVPETLDIGTATVQQLPEMAAVPPSIAPLSQEAGVPGLLGQLLGVVQSIADWLTSGKENKPMSAPIEAETVTPLPPTEEYTIGQPGLTTGAEDIAIAPDINDLTATTLGIPDLEQLPVGRLPAELAEPPILSPELLKDWATPIEPTFEPGQDFFASLKQRSFNQSPETETVLPQLLDRVVRVTESLSLLKPPPVPDRPDLHQPSARAAAGQALNNAIQIGTQKPVEPNLYGVSNSTGNAKGGAPAMQITVHINMQGQGDRAGVKEAAEQGLTAAHDAFLERWEQGVSQPRNNPRMRTSIH